MTLVTLLVAAAVRADPADAERAWREAAPDLIRRRVGPDATGGRPDAAGGQRAPSGGEPGVTDAPVERR
jgi:hypothetical protein